MSPNPANARSLPRFIRRILAGTRSSGVADCHVVITTLPPGRSIHRHSSSATGTEAANWSASMLTTASAALSGNPVAG
jgi:hypothetical protein